MSVCCFPIIYTAIEIWWHLLPSTEKKRKIFIASLYLEIILPLCTEKIHVKRAEAFFFMVVLIWKLGV